MMRARGHNKTLLSRIPRWQSESRYLQTVTDQNNVGFTGIKPEWWLTKYLQHSYIYIHTRVCVVLSNVQCPITKRMNVNGE
jgi:hypothetical protein